MKVEILRPILYDIAKKRAQEREYTPELFYASELGECPRSIYFKRTPLTRREPWPKNYLLLEDGHDLHRRVQSDLKAAGILLELEELLYASKHRVQGHYDGVISLEVVVNGERILLEIKTMNKKKFEDTFVINKPLLSHRKQANFYAIQKGVKHILFFYYCKDNGKTLEFLETVDEELYRATIEMIKSINLCLLHKIEPEERHKEDCYFCAYSWHCNPRVGRIVL